eukprot:CAMPEP_0177406244 /NCGR_PEP_ID=MMETSP0368-20130122/62460_1 /TAXON_ID=447022 ORGANISM="Scrippsiella hangoei-like, Strain SHHI-4" /NCGR_SAMPLE_ID=MMETSP0368 /ASSEMBLY_ACC=CAM_ASM_000363 /LENGTH=73 /DNA_ID=CAMNT_0018874639 /DNA_START=12 /DNA_END=230 /DNA_ORIENTATION=+
MRACLPLWPEGTCAPLRVPARVRHIGNARPESVDQLSAFGRRCQRGAPSTTRRAAELAYGWLKSYVPLWPQIS